MMPKLFLLKEMAPPEIRTKFLSTRRYFTFRKKNPDFFSKEWGGGITEQGSFFTRQGTFCKATVVANHFLETDLEKLKAAVSMGYARGRLFERVPRDRKDWYD